MLNCELCNYLKSMNVNGLNKKVSVCEYTNFVFKRNIEDYDMEYPCYQADMNKIDAEEASIDERKLA